MVTEILFTDSPIAIPSVQLPSREIGAVVEFHGLVRELERGEALAGLQYEAYHPMAIRQLERIFAELHKEHPIAAVTFIHRLGWVPVGEASMYLRVLASHRGEAFLFCHTAIDRMKQDVPIWKAVRSPRNG